MNKLFQYLTNPKFLLGILVGVGVVMLLGYTSRLALLPFAILLLCPLGMVAMMLMMRHK